jgi:hypothetical protein
LAGVFRIWVKLPATTMRSPACTMSKTLPSMTYGVADDGTSPTTPSCAVPAACAVPVATASVTTTVVTRTAQSDFQRLIKVSIPP